MRSAYRILAFVIAAEVIIQAAAIAYAIFGLGTWIQSGGVLDKAAMESETTAFTGDGGFALHGINGEMVFPLLVLILLVLSFFAKVPRGVMWAGVALRPDRPADRVRPARPRAPHPRRAARRQRTADLRRRGDGRHGRARQRPGRGAHHRRRGLSRAVAARRAPRAHGHRRRRRRGGARGAGLAVVVEPAAVALLRDGHGLRRHRRRPGAPAAVAMAGMPGMAPGRSVATLTDPSTGAGRRPGHAGRPQGADAPRVRPGDRRLHAQRHLPRPADHRGRGPARRGAAAERVGARGRRAALARGGRARRRGRHRGRHAGRGAAGRRVRLPVPRRPRGHVLVPLPPGHPRAGRTRAVRRAGRHAAHPRHGGGRARARAPLRRAAAPSTAGRATCPSRRRRAPRCGCGSSTPTRARCGCGRPAASSGVVAVDGREVHGPTPLRDTSVEVTAGGRADLEVVAPPPGRRRARRDRRQRGDRARHATAADPGARRPPSTC